MNERQSDPEPRGWSGRRIAALVLIVFILILAGWIIWTDPSKWGYVAGFGIPLFVAVVFVGAGGRYPEWLVGADDRIRRLFGLSILTEEDDPSHLSPKVYLPILLVVILVAALLFLLFRLGVI